MRAEAAAILRQAPPAVPPVCHPGPRPFWSVIIPTRDRLQYLTQTLESVLRQNIGPDEMQIEVVDNCSTKLDVQGIVREVGGGRIDYYSQPSLVTIAENWTTCIRRARGHWVHIMHDDDVLEPGFYSAFRELIEREPELVFALCRVLQIDGQDRVMGERFGPPGMDRSGIIDRFPVRIAESDWIAAPSVVVCRSAYERAGGFLPLSHVLDWEMWVRLGALGPVGYVHRPLLRNRNHTGSVSARSFRTGRHIAEIAVMIDYTAERLPPSDQAGARAAARSEYARYAAYMSSILANQREYRAAVHHALCAVRLSPGTASVRSVINSVLAAAQGMVSALLTGGTPPPV